MGMLTYGTEWIRDGDDGDAARMIYIDEQTVLRSTARNSRCRRFDTYVAKLSASVSSVYME